MEHQSRIDHIAALRTDQAERDGVAIGRPASLPDFVRDNHLRNHAAHIARDGRE